LTGDDAEHREDGGTKDAHHRPDLWFVQFDHSPIVAAIPAAFQRMPGIWGTKCDLWTTGALAAHLAPHHHLIASD
jgi:hypothetical protein